VANFLVQASGFVLLPIYIRCLSPAEYGQLEVLGRLAETVSTCLLFGGFGQALLTFYKQAEREEERRQVAGTTLGLVALNCIGGGVLALALAGPASGWLGRFMQAGSPPIPAWLLRLAVVGILIEPFCLLPLTLLQARLQSLTYVAISVSQFLTRITLCIVLVKGLDGGVGGALLATALTGAAFGTLLTLAEIWRGVAWPDWGRARALVRFALPLLPGGLCFFILHHGDRFLLLRYCPGAEVGTYSLGYKLAQVAGTFGLIPLYRVWGVQMYGVARQPDAAEVFGRAITRILGFYLLVALGLALFQDEVVRILGGRAYAAATHVVGPVLLACFCQAAASLMDGAFYVRRRMGLKLGITLATTAVMLLLYALLIPRWGGMGAALATLGGFAFLAGATWTVSRRVFPIRFEWKRLLGVLTLTAALWLASRALPAATWAIPLKGGLWLAWPALAWQVGLLSAAEKEYLVDLFRRASRIAGGTFFRPFSLRKVRKPTTGSDGSLVRWASGGTTRSARST
jgi:O-antigen/teichoic acid export membrane protein